MLGACAAMADGLPLADQFRSPPSQLRSQPLWHLNGALEKGEVIRQLQAARNDSGFAGVALLPVRETRPPYLSDGYFARYGEILDACRDLGLNVIFYDDVGFPSGSAGKLMRERFPEHLQCRLDLAESEVIGPAEWARPRPPGTLMAVVAMNTETLERIEIVTPEAPAAGLTWQVPEGAWKIMLFTCVRGKGNKVDYLSPEAVDAFFSLTYNELYRRFSDHFGSTITMTFFDDVGLRKEARRNWTPGFNAAFEKKHGTSPATLYPALWHDIGPDTAAARVALFSQRAEMLSDAFPRKVQEWAAAHGVKSSGHAMGQYHPQPTFMAGDAIKFYEHSDIPMIDSIHYYGHGRPGFKLTSSASFTYDKPLTSVEIYGNYRGKFDKAMLYRSGMELFARGTNVFLPHGMWYQPEKMRIQPLTSHSNPDVAPHLATYNDWVARCSLLLRGGRHVADIGVLYPIAAMQAHARLNAVVDQRGEKGNVHPGLFIPPECDLNELSDSLTGGARRDFTFLHPEILDGRCEVDGPALRLRNQVNHESYRVIVIPGCQVIHWSNLQKIKAFYEAGGHVVATTALPRQSAEYGHDADVRACLQALFGAASTPASGAGKATVNQNAAGGTAHFLPAFKQDRDSLTQALKQVLPHPDVAISGMGPTIDGDQGMVSYLHKVKDGRHVYFVANSTDQPVNGTIRLRGELNLELWEPHSGDMRAIDATHNRQGDHVHTTAPLTLDALASVFLVEVN
jgi:hypothetical protein